MYEKLKAEIERRLGRQLEGFHSVPERVWKRLLKSTRFRSLCKHAAGDDEQSITKAYWVVWGVLQYAESPSDKRYEKPSAKARYKQLLHFVNCYIVVAYAIKNDFCHTTESGEVVIDRFDIYWHHHWMYTPDVNLEMIRLMWNECHPAAAFSNPKVFKQTCDRALESLPKEYYNDLLSRVIRPDEKARGSAVLPRLKRGAEQSELACIEMWRHCSEVLGFGRSNWQIVAVPYNRTFDTTKTSQTGRQLCNRYYKLKAKAEQEGWDNDSKPTPPESRARRCKTQEDYLAMLEQEAAKDDSQAAE